MSTQDSLKKAGDFIRTSVTLKMVSIGILILILLIPASMTFDLMWERKARRDTVVNELNQKWGSQQTITGPFLTVPYKVFYKDSDDEVKFNLHYLHILPEQLKINGELTPHVRYRSIYEAVLYNAKLSLTGVFKTPNLSQMEIEQDNILWDKAVFSLGITDMRGIQKNITINFDNKHYDVTPGLKTIHIASSGISANIPYSQTEAEHPFSLELDVNGSEQIQFIPVAEETTAQLKSSWPSPSFNGAFLPTQREVTNDGFSANWKVLHLNRNYPQFWEGSQYDVKSSAFGLKLLITADIYQKNERVSKYAVMFILFTFAAFFFSEILNRKRVHPIQYLMVGMAVILFYVLLLAISEHVNFDFAYILSALAITLLVTGYAQGMMKNRYFTLTVLATLGVLYAYLYIVLQLEDYALLMGSIGLLLVLSGIMYLTRKIDWYAIDKDDWK